VEIACDLLVECEACLEGAPDRAGCGNGPQARNLSPGQRYGEMDVELHPRGVVSGS
jgi:hypothetical protein